MMNNTMETLRNVLKIIHRTKTVTGKSIGRKKEYINQNKKQHEHSTAATTSTTTTETRTWSIKTQYI